jgi:hypothetical protein
MTSLQGRKRDGVADVLITDAERGATEKVLPSFVERGTLGGETICLKTPGFGQSCLRLVRLIMPTDFRDPGVVLTATIQEVR